MTDLRQRIIDRIETIKKTLDEMQIELRALQDVLGNDAPQKNLEKYAAKAKKKEDFENKPRRHRRTRAEMEAYRAQIASQRTGKTKPDHEYEHEEGVKKNAYSCNTCGRVFMSTAKHLDAVCPGEHCGGIHISKSTREAFREFVNSHMDVSKAPE